MKKEYNIEFYNSIKKIMNVPVKLLFNPEVIGIENIPNKPYILAGNHKSMFDIPLLITNIPDDIHFMAKKELFNLILIRDVFSKMGAFPVDRKSGLSALRTSIKLLNNNEIVGIFPEGTRNKTDDIILPFKEGVASIATRTNSLIVPFGISGKYVRNKLKLNIGEPIDIKEIEKDKQTKYLEEKVKELILK